MSGVELASVVIASFLAAYLSAALLMPEWFE
jgi:K+-transporting ATPase KdpF subunit